MRYGVYFAAAVGKVPAPEASRLFSDVHLYSLMFSTCFFGLLFPEHFLGFLEVVVVLLFGIGRVGKCLQFVAGVPTQTMLLL